MVKCFLLLVFSSDFPQTVFHPGASSLDFLKVSSLQNSEKGFGLKWNETWQVMSISSREQAFNFKNVLL